MTKEISVADRNRPKLVKYLEPNSRKFRSRARGSMLETMIWKSLLVYCGISNGLDIIIYKLQPFVKDF